MKHATLFAILFLAKHSLCFAQIEITVTKFPADSFIISLPPETKLETGKTYTFKFNTNIVLADSIREGFTQQYLYNGLSVSQTFDHYERAFYLTRRTKSLRTNSTFLASTTWYMYGTSQWKFTLDGQKISRYVPADIHRSSVVDIKLQSDLYDISKVSFDGPLIIYWLENPAQKVSIDLSASCVQINLADYKSFQGPPNGDANYYHIVFLLPNVRVNGKKLFKEEPPHRMYIFKFLEK